MEKSNFLNEHEQKSNGVDPVNVLHLSIAVLVVLETIKHFDDTWNVQVQQERALTFFRSIVICLQKKMLPEMVFFR